MKGYPNSSRNTLFRTLPGELGVERSYSRPRVSNDNPYSESHFHTVKYQPDYPGRFRDLGHARRWCDEFFRWYNTDHHHDGLALYTPEDVFFGRVDAIAVQREAALLDAYRRHPERFLRGQPTVPRPPDRVLLNPADGERPPTAEQVLATPADELETLWPQPATAGVPVINIPGASSLPGSNPQSQLAT